MLERGVSMEFFDLVKRRRSIRKYQDRQIERGDLEKIIQAGLCAPNALATDSARSSSQCETAHFAKKSGG